MDVVMRFWTYFVFLVFLFHATAESPNQKHDHPNGFWFGTQSIFCMKTKPGYFPRLSRRSLFTATATPPYRNSLRYVHRLVFYRGTVFEWGTGVRGYHVGEAASVTDCPVTWESSPAGESRCPLDAPFQFTRDYRNRFGPYHLLNNNCHHFANRISKLLSDADCGASSRDEGVADGIVSIAEKYLWKIVNFVLSYLAPARNRESKPEVQILPNDEIITK